MAAALLLAACEPKVQDNHRHLAEEWCRQWVDFQEQCTYGGPFEFTDEAKLERRAGCESDPAWDWTDECGDLKWEALSCSSSLTCEEYQIRSNPETPPDLWPCRAAERAFYDACKYSETGEPIDHGG